MKLLQIFVIAFIFTAVNAQAQQIVLKGLSPQQQGLVRYNPVVNYQYKYLGDTAKFTEIDFWGHNFSQEVKNHEGAGIAMQKFRENRLAGLITGSAALASFGGFAITALNSGSGDLPGVFLLGTIALGGASYYLLHNSNSHIEDAARKFNTERAMHYPPQSPAKSYGSTAQPGINLGFSFRF